MSPPAELMILDDQGRICWVNPAKRQRLGEELAEHVLGHTCQEFPIVCPARCEPVCAVHELTGTPPLTPGDLPAHRHVPPRRMETDITPLGLPGDRRLSVVRHRVDADGAPGLGPGGLTPRGDLWAAMAAVTMGLSHELRNPLLAVSMRLEALVRRPGYALSDPAREAVEQTLEVVHRMGEVIDRLCTFSPSEASGSPPTDARAAAEAVLSEQAQALEGLTVTLADEGARPVLVDPLHLRLVLEQLIENAAEAMGGRGRLTITLTSEGAWSYIDVADTGPGIAPEIQKRLGQPFVTTKPPGHGSGLGLSLCQLFVDRHGGTLRVLRTGPGGTTVRVALPCTDPAQGVNP